MARRWLSTPHGETRAQPVPEEKMGDFPDPPPLRSAAEGRDGPSQRFGSSARRCHLPASLAAPVCSLGGGGQSEKQKA